MYVYLMANLYNVFMNVHIFMDNFYTFLVKLQTLHIAFNLTLFTTSLQHWAQQEKHKIYQMDLNTDEIYTKYNSIFDHKFRCLWKKNNVK